jgi:ATP-dependent exoDNAse (exonuclease V) beta subunit
MIRSFELTAESDAFIQFFLDFVFDFSQRKSQKSTSFLSYWQEKKDKLNIVSSEDLRAIRIMTIHKSKGLEFPVVLFPYHLDIYDEINPKAWYSELNEEHFDGFESILVDSSAGIKKTGHHGNWIFEEQRKEKELDSFNLLYVCLTRAIEQLHVITELKKSSSGISSSAHLFKDYLDSIGLWDSHQLHYEFGDPSRMSSRKPPGGNSESQQDFISSSWKEEHQIHIVANSDLMWDTNRAAAIGYGNLVHEIMERIYTVEDVEVVLESFLNKGLVPREVSGELRALLSSIVNHPELRMYFESGPVIINEREILTDTGHTIIPDRLVINGKKAVVIDYKTGNQDPGHLLQIENYALVLQKLNYVVTEKILVYINQGVTVVKSASKL